MKNEKEYNYGLALLRIFMCFEVILCHFYSGESKFLFLFDVLKNYAVPVFMMMSFLLTEKMFLAKDNDLLKRRIYRLAVPLIGWGVIYLLFYLGVQLVTGVNISQSKSIADYVRNAFTGHAMWYQIDLIVLSLVFFLIFCVLEMRTGIVLINVLFVISIYLQYSGINMAIFNTCGPYKYILGRLFEMMPYAVIGFDLAYFGLYQKAEKFRTIAIVCSLAGGILILNIILPIGLLFRGPSNVPGFGYAGGIGIIFSILIVAIAYLIPQRWFTESMKKCISFLSPYTLGIYCMHYLIGELLTMKVKELSFLMCIFMFIICYIVSVLMRRIPIKSVQMLIK